MNSKSLDMLHKKAKNNCDFIPHYEKEKIKLFRKNFDILNKKHKKLMQSLAQL